jgi:hypothetical protein
MERMNPLSGWVGADQEDRKEQTRVFMVSIVITVAANTMTLFIQLHSRLTENGSDVITHGNDRLSACPLRQSVQPIFPHS